MDLNLLTYEMKDIDDYIQLLKDDGLTDQKNIVWKYDSRQNKMVGYVNIPCAFDTETTNLIKKLIDRIIKTGFMWIWMFGFFYRRKFYCICGRTWDDYKKLLKRLNKAFDLYDTDKSCKRLLCFIHNMPFDLQFFRIPFRDDYKDMFINDSRTPLYAIFGNIEYHDSYIVSGSKLETVGKNLVTYKWTKKVGKLDYSLCRTQSTTLTKDEWDYVWSDICVQLCYIQQLLDQEATGKIFNIPLTATGFPRREVRTKMLANKKLRKRIQGLKISSLKEMKIWKALFTGGHTHGDIYHRGNVVDDVTSKDFTSSYVASALAYEMPFSNGKECHFNTVEEFLNRGKTMIVIGKVHLFNVKLKDGMPDATIPINKCTTLHNAIKDNDNGKVRRADDLVIYVSHLSMRLIDMYYTYDKDKVAFGTCYEYHKAYLPKEYFECCLDYYEQKTTLKGVVGREIEYQNGKARLNSVAFGMLCMDEVFRPIFKYDKDYVDAENGITGWEREKEPTDEEAQKALDEYNNSNSRFTWFPIGCWITEISRYALLSCIYEFRTEGNKSDGVSDYVYSDTDCIKCRHYEKHKDVFEAYNKMITYRLEKACEYHGIDPKRLRPKTADIVDEETGEIIPGVEKPLGVWDDDGHYSKFKFLHSKCYIGIRDDGKDDGLHCTIAGVSKDKAEAYLSKFDDPFEAFCDGMEIPAEESDKLCHHYDDTCFTETITDYQGHTDIVEIQGGVCLEKVPFKINDMVNYRTIAEELQKDFNI